MQHHQKPRQSYPSEQYFQDEQSQFPDYSFEDDFQAPMHPQTFSGNPKPNPNNFSGRALPQVPPQTTYVPPQQTQAQAPYCKCGQPAVEKMSGPTAKNPDQPFWTCHISKDQGGCGFFQFLNPALNKTWPAKNPNKRTYSQVQPQGPQQPAKIQTTTDNSISESNLMLAQTLHMTTGKHEKMLISLQQRVQALEQENSVMREHIENLMSPKEETQKN